MHIIGFIGSILFLVLQSVAVFTKSERECMIIVGIVLALGITCVPMFILTS